MDLGVIILYMMSSGHKVPIQNMYRELTKVSPLFYYLEKNRITAEELKTVFKQDECNKKAL